MKNFILLVALFLVAPFAQGSSPQHLLVGGSGWNKIAIINKDTKEIVGGSHESGRNSFFLLQRSKNDNP